MVNVVQQNVYTGVYFVWENVDLNKMTGGNSELYGCYLAHRLDKRQRQYFKQECKWPCDDLYIIKDIYGGFLKFLKE